MRLTEFCKSLVKFSTLKYSNYILLMIVERIYVVNSF